MGCAGTMATAAVAGCRGAAGAHGSNGFKLADVHSACEVVNGTMEPLKEYEDFEY